MANEEQIEIWNSQVGVKWVAMQEILDRQLEPIAKELLQAAAAQPGEAVLDVGCGCGATSLMVGEQVGSDGQVVGVDISAPMLVRARERADEAGMNWVLFNEGDAQSHSFDAHAFDIALSRFGVMFFEDPVAAFANIRSALKPDGRFVFLCWRSVMENPWVTVPMMAVKELVELPASPDPTAPGPFALADKERTQSFLENAGFAKVDVEPLDIKMNIGIGADLDDSVDFLFKIGPVSRILAEVDEEIRAKAHQALLKALAPFQTDRGVEMDAAMWIVTARNA